MSRAEDRREEAERCLDAVDVMRDNGGEDSMAYTALAGEATAHALLAVEGRLGEIAEHLHTANLIAGYHAAETGFDREGYAVDWGDVEETILRRLGMIADGGA